MLIREGIETEQDLSCYQKKETGWIDGLKEEQKTLRNRLRRCLPEEEAGLRSRLADVNIKLFTLRSDARILGRIGDRVADMQRRIQLAEQSAAGAEERQQNISTQRQGL